MTPFSAQGALSLPGAPGLPVDSLPFGMFSMYDSKANFEYLLPDTTGTQVVDFGTVPAAGVKFMLLTYESAADSPPVVLVTVNAGSHPIELSHGGFLCIGSPSPAAGITSMSLDYTGEGKVRVWLLG